MHTVTYIVGQIATIDISSSETVAVSSTVVDIPGGFVPRRCRSDGVYNTEVTMRCNQPMCGFVTVMMFGFAGVISAIIYSSILIANGS